tara:strand:+ start:256 stop:561 length:306 start_codon:yes stop_codon:yes gene_type:complete
MNKVIKFKDGFSWLQLTPRQALKLYATNQFGMYAIFEQDESESLLESIEEVTECLEQGTPICLELGRIIKPKRESWFHKADKILSEGYWYAKISDIKFDIV